MNNVVGNEGMRDLNVGDKLVYKAGSPPHCIQAICIVSQPPGLNGVSVIINNITYQDVRAEPIEEADEIVADPNELYYC